MDAFLDPIIFQPYILQNYRTVSVGLGMSLKNTRAPATYEIRSMIGQRVGGDIRRFADLVFVLYFVVDFNTRYSAVKAKAFLISKHKASENIYDNIELLSKM
jgi:hypothetical protein